MIVACFAAVCELRQLGIQNMRINALTATSTLNALSFHAQFWFFKSILKTHIIIAHPRWTSDCKICIPFTPPFHGYSNHSISLHWTLWCPHFGVTGSPSNQWEWSFAMFDWLMRLPHLYLCCLYCLWIQEWWYSHYLHNSSSVPGRRDRKKLVSLSLRLQYIRTDSGKSH